MQRPRCRRSVGESLVLPSCIGSSVLGRDEAANEEPLETGGPGGRGEGAGGRADQGRGEPNLAALSLRLSRRRLSRQIARDIRSSRPEVSSLAASSSLSSSFKPLINTPCKALSSHPHSAARMRKSTEYWETVLDPCCKERSLLLASLPCKGWSKIFLISAVNKGS